VPGGKAAASPVNLLTVVRRDAASVGGSLFPSMGDTGEPVFDTDERTLWSGPLRVFLLRERANGRPLVLTWEFPAPANVWLTDRRLVFSCKKFTAGDWKKLAIAWTDSVGFLTEALASTVNSVTAEARRHGRIAVGQVRHEWPVNVRLTRHKPRVGRQQALLGLTCVDPWDDAQVRLLLGDSSESLIAGLAQTAVQAIAEHRLRRSVPEEAVALLTQQEAHPVTTDGRHPFGPGPESSNVFSGRPSRDALTFSLPGAAKIS
jgi:hypothetical protein